MIIAEKEIKVAILMATYNGTRFLSEQIDSIISQTFKNWTLFIRDDGSSDGTDRIIDSYCEMYPDKIIRINGDYDNHGSNYNFATLQQYVNRLDCFTYFMFCDQDDVWLNDKVEKTLVVMLENDVSGDAVLIHTDLKVVDDKLSTIGESFFKYRALNPDVNDINHLLIQNNVTGCTMMWNRALDELLGDSLFNESVFQHDWWIALVACCFGRIVPMKVSTILYRQHGSNVIGATKVNTVGFVIRRLLGKNYVKGTLQKSVKQANGFYRYFNEKLDHKNASIINDYSTLYNKRKISRMITVLRHGYLKQGIIQIIGELIYI